MKPVKLCAEHLGLLQPAVALSDAALLLAKRHWHAGGLVEPWLAPLAAGLRQGYGRTGRLQQSMDFVGNWTRKPIYFWLSPLGGNRSVFRCKCILR